MKFREIRRVNKREVVKSENEIISLEMGKSGFKGFEFKSESFHDESKPTSFSNMEPKFDFESKVNE